MALFLSTYINKVDRKGRVSVPAAFRGALGDAAAGGVVLFRSHAHECLEGVGLSFMQEISARLDRFDLFSADQDDLALSVFGDSVQLALDSDGRMILPEALLEFAKLDGDAAFVGLGRKFQIWNPVTLAARKDKARAAVADKGLTIPQGGAS
jgi:MraZ protein